MKDNVILPKKLTHANGAKGLLMGEFYEQITVENGEYCGCGECDYCHEFPETPPTIILDIPVSWDTIKAIYDKIVQELGAT